MVGAPLGLPPLYCGQFIFCGPGWAAAGGERGGGGGAVFELVERGEGAREDCLTSFRRHLGVITSFCARAPVREKSKDHQ